MDAQQPPATLVLAYRYATLIDDRRFDELHQIMTPAVRIAGPGYVMDSLPEVQRGMEVLRQYDRTFHLVGNQWGEWDAQGVWSGETYCIASHVYPRDGAEWKLDMAIRYQDRIVRHDGALRFATRELRVVWVQDLPLQMPR